MFHPVAVDAFCDELEKSALAERLVRLAATDIPKTPRLLMKKRSPAELKQLQEAFEKGYSKRITDPIMRKLDPLVQKLPEGKAKTLAGKGARMVAEDPVGNVAANLVPFPGAHPAYIAGKKGLERAIDRLSPIP